MIKKKGMNPALARMTQIQKDNMLISLGRFIFCDATGTPVEGFKVHERAQDIYERSDKTQFATEIVSATVNLIDRLMRENGGTAKEWRK